MAEDRESLRPEADLPGGGEGVLIVTMAAVVVVSLLGIVSLLY